MELSSNQAIKEWRRLPSIVSHIHIGFLQAAQQIMELQEAAQIHQGLQPSNIARSTSVHDMKAIVKTWRYEWHIITLCEGLEFRIFYCYWKPTNGSDGEVGFGLLMSSLSQMMIMCILFFVCHWYILYCDEYAVKNQIWNWHTLWKTHIYLAVAKMWVSTN